jgi:hypothetical protein
MLRISVMELLCESTSMGGKMESYKGGKAGSSHSVSLELLASLGHQQCMMRHLGALMIHG